MQPLKLIQTVYSNKADGIHSKVALWFNVEHKMAEFAMYVYVRINGVYLKVEVSLPIRISILARVVFNKVKRYKEWNLEQGVIHIPNSLAFLLLYIKVEVTIYVGVSV